MQKTLLAIDARGKHENIPQEIHCKSMERIPQMNKMQTVFNVSNVLQYDKKTSIASKTTRNMYKAWDSHDSKQSSRAAPFIKKSTSKDNQSVDKQEIASKSQTSKTIHKSVLSKLSPAKDEKSCVQKSSQKTKQALRSCEDKDISQCDKISPEILSQKQSSQLRTTRNKDSARFNGAAKSSMVAFEPPEPVIFDPECWPEELKILQMQEKQHSTIAGIVSKHFIRQRIRERCNNYNRSFEQQISPLDQTPFQYYGTDEKVPLTSLRHYLKEKIIQNLKNEEQKQLWEKLQFRKEGLMTPATPKFINQPTQSQYLSSENNQSSNNGTNLARTTTAPIGSNDINQQYSIAAEELLSSQNNSKEKSLNLNLDSPKSTGLFFNTNMHPSQTQYPSTKQQSILNHSSLANLVVDPAGTFRIDKASNTLNSGTSNASIQKAAVQLMSDSTIRTISELEHVDSTSIPNNIIEKLDESKKFTLFKECDQIRKAFPSQKKGNSRVTFSNLDKARLHKYRIPPKPSSLDSFDLRTLRCARQNQQQYQQAYPQKSAIVQLLEQNVMLPQLSQQDLGSRTGSNSPQRVNSSEKKSSVSKQQLRQAKSSLFNLEIQNFKLKKPKVLQRKKNTQVYEQDIKTKQSDEQLHEMEKSSSLQKSLHDSVLQVSSKQLPLVKLDSSSRLKNQSCSSITKQKNEQPGRKPIHRQSKSNQRSTLLASPKSSFREHNSDFHSEEDSETQYLSHVSRHGVFGAQSSMRVLDYNVNRKTSLDEIQLFVREENNSCNGDKQDEMKVMSSAKKSLKKRNQKTDKSLHRRLKDIAHRIKYQDRRIQKSMIEDVQTTKMSQLSGSQHDTDAKKVSDKINESQLGLESNTQPELKLLKQVGKVAINKKINNDISSQMIQRKSRLNEESLTPKKAKEFKSIQIKLWEAEGLPENSKVWAFKKHF